MNKTLDRSTAIIIAFLTLIGLALRVAMADGALWLDEAWSFEFARKSGDIFGVLARINHDNNHHLNTLWMQWTGPWAHPVVIRGLAIVCGTATIPVAALIASRAGRTAAILTAALFAVSPFMMLYGSEARGYAPAFLAILLSILLIQQWAAGGASPRRALAVVAGLGAFSHLFVVPTLFVIAGWAVIARAETQPWRQAITDTARTLDLALITAAAILGTVLGGAAGLGGMVFGSLTPWTAAAVISGCRELFSMTLGQFSLTGLALIAIAGALLLAAGPRPTLSRWALWFFLLAAFPTAAMLFQLDNSMYARYYYPSALGVLLMLGERLGAVFESGGRGRILAVLTGLAMIAPMAPADRLVLRVDRGDLNRPLRVMTERSPARPVVVQLLNERERPTIELSGKQLRVPVKVAWQACDDRANFLMGSRLSDLGAPRVFRCGASWKLIAANRVDMLSTEPWWLYAREGLSVHRTAANGPVSQRRNPS